MAEKVLLVKDPHGYVTHYFIPTVLRRVYATVQVFEVTSYQKGPDGEYNVELDAELVCTSTIKWDGCSHVNFAEEGYQHLCGKSSWIAFSKMMVALYEAVVPLIPEYDSKVAEDA